MPELERVIFLHLNISLVLVRGKSVLSTKFRYPLVNHIRQLFTVQTGIK